MIADKCPICGANGRIWNKEPDVFKCLQCWSFYSEFGLVLEPQREFHQLWS